MGLVQTNLIDSNLKSAVKYQCVLAKNRDKEKATTSPSRSAGASNKGNSRATDSGREQVHAYPSWSREGKKEGSAWTDSSKRW